MKRILTIFTLAFAISMIACRKNNQSDGYTYYQVGFKTQNTDWRDTAMIVRTKDMQLIQKAEAQLAMPIQDRQIVFGALLPGNDGYNKNGSHTFKWHFDENDWKMVDVTAEIYDGKPYTDLDLHPSYWLDTIKRFGAWGSYISKRLP